MKLWNIVLSGWLLLGLPAVVQAQFTATTNNGAITITGYLGTSGNVIIPGMIDGYPVTGIGGFYSFTSLTNITVPASVTYITSGAFEYQGRLTAILVDAQNTDYSSTNGVLFDKQQTLLIQAPGGMAGSYVVPVSVAKIGDDAFNDCASLTNVTIGTNVTSIGVGTFNSCAGLTGIAIPGSVTNIGSGAFADCQSLTAITVDPECVFYSSTNGILFDKPQTTLIQAPGGIAGSPTIPSRVTSIGTGAFSDCTGLTSITIPDSVTNIDSQAFYFCSHLTNCALGTNVTSIGDNAFYQCAGLTSLTIPNRVTSIGDAAFEYCSGLTNLTLGTNLISLGNDAFHDCSGLAALLIPNNVTNIGNGAFEDCGSLTNVSIGTNVTTIGSDAFAYCANLTGIAIPGSVTNIVGTSLGLVRLGAGTTPAAIEMVANCSRLTAITVDGQNLFYSSANGILFNKPQTALLEAPGAFAGGYAIPGSVTSIGAEAFQNCAGLGSVTIPSTVTNIGNAAFAACGSLTALTVDGQNQFYRGINGILFDPPQTTLIQFPGGLGGSYTVSNGIISLGGTAFSGCSNLTRIAIPASVTNVGSSTFANCTHAGIYFAGNAPGITSSGSIGIPIGSLSPPPPFGNNFYNPSAEAVYYLPGTTGWSTTFEGQPAYLWVPPYVCTPTSNSITINGFMGSGGSITIPDTINGLPVTAIASGVFDNAAGPGLTNVIIGTNVVTIGSYAFAACTSLASITIPNSVTSIGSYAFAFCDNLDSVYFAGNAPGADSTVFFHWSNFFPPVYEPPTPTTVYYLPGTTGWSTTFGGQPTVLWNPLAQTSGASFGVRANGFGFNITGASNLIVVVEATTNLSSPDWQPVQTNTLTTGSVYFSDPQWTDYPSRFYRLRSP